MNRVFRGALFPILIVIVLAFFVAKLLSPSTSSGVVHNYQSFTTKDLPQKAVQSFTVDPSNNAINVTLDSGVRYSVGYDPGTSMLPTLLNEVSSLNKAGANVKYNIVPKSSSTWSSLLLYLL